MAARPTLNTSGDTIRVEGLREFQAELRKTEGRMPSELRRANMKAAEVIAVPARARAVSLGGVAAKIAPSIKAAGQQRAALVQIGGAAYPMAMGANFGAHHDVERQTKRGPMLGWNQFPLPTKPDRILFRTIDETRGAFIGEYDRMIDLLMQGPFPT